jgi:hypothetical protein
VFLEHRCANRTRSSPGRLSPYADEGTSLIQRLASGPPEMPAGSRFLVFPAKRIVCRNKGRAPKSCAT